MAAFKLAICGGGPSGLVLANIIAREAPQGSFELSVFESGKANRDQGSGWDMNKAALGALARAGINASDIQRESSDTFRLFRTGKSEPELATHTPQLLKRFGLKLPWTGKETDRTVMIDLLVASLKGRGEIYFDTRIGDAVPLPGGRVGLLDCDGESLGDFDIVVDCTGTRGALRSKRFSSGAEYTGVTLVQGIIDSLEESCSSEIIRRVGEGTAMVSGPDKSGLGAVTLTLQRFGADPADKRTKCTLSVPVADPDALPRRLGFRASGKVDEIANARAWFAEQLSSEGWEEDYRTAAASVNFVRVLPIFWHPNGDADVIDDASLPVLCIGDALHALPPWSGMSGNLALADAADCATALVAFASSASPASAESAALVARLRELETAFLKRAEAERPRASRVAECYRTIWPKTNYEDWKLVSWITGEGGGKEGEVDPWEIWGIEKTFALLGWLHRREGWGMLPAASN